MSEIKKNLEQDLKSLCRLQFLQLSDYQEHYLKSCEQVQEYQDLLQIRAYPFSVKMYRDFYAALGERQILAEEFLNATHLELLEKFSCYNREDLMQLSKELCNVIEGDEIVMEVIEEDGCALSGPTADY